MVYDGHLRWFIDLFFLLSLLFVFGLVQGIKKLIWIPK